MNSYAYVKWRSFVALISNFSSISQEKKYFLGRLDALLTL